MNDKRTQEIIALRKQGRSLRKIGRVFKITGERVRQIIKPFNILIPKSPKSPKRMCACIRCGRVYQFFLRKKKKEYHSLKFCSKRCRRWFYAVMKKNRLLRNKISSRMNSRKYYHAHKNEPWFRKKLKQQYEKNGRKYQREYYHAHKKDPVLRRRYLEYARKYQRRPEVVARRKRYYQERREKILRALSAKRKGR